jgi:hypothetical protein
VGLSQSSQFNFDEPLTLLEWRSLGELPEWSNGAVSKTVKRFAFRGFESLTLRHLIFWPVELGPDPASDGVWFWKIFVDI